MAAERRHIRRALDQTGGEIGQAARLLGISRTTLWEKMRRLGISGAGTVASGNPDIGVRSCSAILTCDGDASPARCPRSPAFPPFRAMAQRLRNPSVFDKKIGRNRCGGATSWSMSAGGNSCAARASRRRAWLRRVSCRSQAKAAPGQALVNYPSNRLANVSDLDVDEPLDVAYPDDDAPGVLIKLGTAGRRRRRSRRRHRRLLDGLPAQGLPAPLQRRRQDAELPRPLFALRLRARRPARSGGRRPRTSRSTRFASTTRGTSTPKAWTSSSTVVCPTCSEGGSDGLQAPHQPAADHPGQRHQAQCHLPLLHRRLRLSRL